MSPGHMYLVVVIVNHGWDLSPADSDWASSMLAGGARLCRLFQKTGADSGRVG